MTQDSSRARRVASMALCALVSLGLVLVVARTAWQHHDPYEFDLLVSEAVAMAAMLAVAGGMPVLLARTRRSGLPSSVLAALAAAAVSCGVLLVLAALEDPAEYEGFITFGEAAYDSRLEITFGSVLLPGTGALVVGALGLLPVAGLLALLPGRTAPVPRRLRLASLAAATTAAGLVLLDLERVLGLRELLLFQAQLLDTAHAVTAVAGLWALSALLLSARAAARDQARALALALPFVLLIAWSALLLSDPPRLENSSVEVSDLFRDYAVVLASLAVGLLPLAVAQLRRVRTSPSTPPG